MSSSGPATTKAGYDDDVGWKLQVGAMVTFLCACIVVILRVTARTKYARLGWDDYFMLFALVQALVATIVDYVAINWGLGRHTFTLTPHQRSREQLLSQIGQVFCIDALTFAKISICIAYLRILSGTGRKVLKQVLYVTVFLVFAVNSSIIVTTFVQCQPAERSWNKAKPGSCWDLVTIISLVLLQGSFSALTDFLLCLFPLFLFKNLQIGRRAKATLLLLMCLGAVTGAFAIVRTVESSTSLHTPSNDSSYGSIPGLTWAAVERNLAIMIGSVPATYPLVTRMDSYLSKTWSRLSPRKTKDSGSGRSGRPDDDASSRDMRLKASSEHLIYPASGNGRRQEERFQEV